MKIKIDLLKEQKIKWEGIIDFGELYKYMKLWLEDNGYANERNLEQRYIERIKGDKKQYEIFWHGTKDKSEFFKYNIDVAILVLGLADVEVEQNGIKRKMQKASYEFKISSYIESTPLWDNLKGLHRIYYNLIIRKRIDDYLRELYGKSTGFHSYIKEFLGLRD